MAGFQNNLLVRLHKWALRQDENFLTETFAFLLEYLVDNEPEAACELVSKLTGGIIILSSQQVRGLEIRTQIRGEEGIPDIELRTAQDFVIIEVKSEAEASEEQLRRYRRLLDQSPATSKGLVLLTRYPVMVAGANLNMRWYQIAELIELECNKYRFKQTSQFLVDQFLGFLKKRNMTMEQVTWEMPMGIRSLRTIADMLHEAAFSVGINGTVKGHRDYMGLNIDGSLYWVGIFYESPESLVFKTEWAKVNKEAAEKLGVGTVNEWTGKQYKGAYGWRVDVNLECEDVHFFARSKASQMQFLEQFLRENYELATRVTLRESIENPVPTVLDEEDQ